MIAIGAVTPGEHKVGLGLTKNEGFDKVLCVSVNSLTLFWGVTKKGIPSALTACATYPQIPFWNNNRKKTVKEHSVLTILTSQ